MKKIDKFTHNLIKENNRKRDVRHTVSLMSVIVMLMVTVVLIIPAISLTKEEYDAGNVPAVPSIDSLSSLTSFTLPDNQVDGVDFRQIQGKDDGNIQEVEFTLSYTLNADDVTISKPYLIYPIDSSNIAVTSDLPGDGDWGKVMDGSLQSGIYHVYPDTNGVSYVLVEFFDNYLAEYSGQSITGTVRFQADVVRDDDNNSSTQTITIGGQQIVVENFQERVMDVEKTGIFNSDDKTITWTVKVYNPDRDDMGGAVVSDQKITAATNLTVVPSGAVTKNGNEVVFNDGVTADLITIIYTEPVSADVLASGQGQSINNVATLTKDTVNKSDNASVYVPSGYNVAKNVYTDLTDGTYVWTITVNNTYGNNLNNFKIEDVMINEMVDGSLTVTGDEDADLSDSVAYSNGTVTLGNITDSQINITYRTQIDKTKEANRYNQIFENNTAVLKNPSNGTLGQATAKAVYQKPFAVKTHEYSSQTGLITYMVQYKHAEGEILQPGNYIEDEYLQYATDIQVHKGYYGPLNSGTDYTLDGDRITLDVALDAVQTARDHPEIMTIKYTIDPKNTNLPGRTANGDSIILDNTAAYGDAIGPIGETTDRYTWNPTNDIDKNVNGNPTKTDNGDGTKTYTIPWQITLDQEPGVFLGKTLTDSTSIKTDSNTITETSSTEDYKHYYNSGSMSIRYTFRDPDNGNNPTERVLNSSYYTVTEDGNGGFTVYFKDEDEAADTPLTYAYNLKLYYSTTSVSSTTEGLKARNDASFNGKNDNADYTLEFFNPDNPPYDKTGEDAYNVQDLTTKMVGDVEYYKIPYVIHYDSTKLEGLENQNMTLVDTMPTGAILDTESGIVVRYNQYYSEAINPYNQNSYSNYYVYNSGENTFKMFIKQDTDLNKRIFDIEYYILLPKDSTDESITTDGSLVISNAIVDEGDIYTPDSVETTLSGSNGPSGNNISKSGGQGSTDGYVNYVLDVNPNAIDMSTGGTIDIEDSLNLANLSTQEALQLYNMSDSSKIDTNVDISNVKVTLDGLKVYEVDNNGTPTLLNHNEYVYEYTGLKKEYSIVDEEYELTLDGNMLKYQNSGARFNAANAGDTYDLLIKCDTPNARISSWKIQGDGIDDISESTAGYGDIICDSEGNYKISDIPVNEAVNLGYLQFGAWYIHSNGHLVSGKFIFHKKVESIKNPTLGLSLPDGKHLRVEYIYKITYESNKEKVGLKLNNSATLDKVGGIETAGSENNISIKDSTSATSSTSVPIKLSKVNLNNMNIEVQAGFNLYRYNSEEDVWEIATDIREKQVTIGRHTYDTHLVSSNQSGEEWNGWEVATSQSTIDSAQTIRTDEYYISLEKGIIYMLVEVEAPNPYILLNEPKFFTYGQDVTSGIASAAKAALSSVPGSFDMDTSDIETVINNHDSEAIYTISNRNYININAKKNWTVTGSINPSDYKVVAGVYRTDRSGRVNTLPSNHDEVMQLIIDRHWEKVDEKELSDANNWSYTWYGDPTITDNSAPNKFNGVELVSGIDDDTPYYYYVVEEAIYKTNDGGNTYTEDVTDEFASSSTARWLIVGTEATLEAGLDHTLGTINLYNSSGLSIKKIWQNEHRVEMTEAELEKVGLTQIEVELYRSITAPEGGTYDEYGIPTDAVKLTSTDLAGVGGITLNGDNVVIRKSDGWEVVPEGLPPNDGENNYYYYIKEVTQIDNSQTVYVDNGQNGGAMFVYNIVEVEDEGGVVLPNTGGRGSKLLRMISLIMILISLITLVYRKRIKVINNKYISKRRRKGGEL